MAIVSGLDWIGTVPPTVKLPNVSFGERDVLVVSSWIMVVHQLIAATTAAFDAGVIYEWAGTFTPAFTIEALLDWSRLWRLWARVQSPGPARAERLRGK